MDDIQFQKAEFAGGGPKCSSCQAAIEHEYYQLSGHVICPDCAQKVQAAQQRPPAGAIVRGAMFGAGMAALCCAGYAIIRWFSPIDWSLIAIAVGYLVGRAVRTGSNGLGGRRMQLIAVGLTYLAIVWSYVPLMLREAEVSSPLLIPVLAVLSLALPVFELAESVGSGILGILIIGFGLLQAWRLTARDPRPLTGPFERAEGAAAGA